MVRIYFAGRDRFQPLPGHHGPFVPEPAVQPDGDAQLDGQPEPAGRRTRHPHLQVPHVGQAGLLEGHSDLYLRNVHSSVHHHQKSLATLQGTLRVCQVGLRGGPRAVLRAVASSVRLRQVSESRPGWKQLVRRPSKPGIVLKVIFCCQCYQ